MENFTNNIIEIDENGELVVQDAEPNNKRIITYASGETEEVTIDTVYDEDAQPGTKLNADFFKELYNKMKTLANGGIELHVEDDVLYITYDDSNAVEEE